MVVGRSAGVVATVSLGDRLGAGRILQATLALSDGV